jgi:hypothetical protein
MIESEVFAGWQWLAFVVSWLSAAGGGALFATVHAGVVLSGGSWTHPYLFHAALLLSFSALVGEMGGGWGAAGASLVCVALPSYLNMGRRAGLIETGPLPEASETADVRDDWRG